MGCRAAIIAYPAHAPHQIQLAMTDKTRNCPNCDTPQEPDAAQPSKWTCPACGHVSHAYTPSAANALDLRQHHEASLTSHDQVGGLPAREIHEATTPQGDSFVHKTDRAVDSSTVDREFKLAQPYHRTREDKQREERDAVQRILQQYNRVHSSDYDTVKSDPEDRDTDVIVSSTSGRHADFKVQVVTEGSDVWRDLAQTAEYADTMSESSYLAQLERDLQGKVTRADPRIVLVYEGPGIVTPGTLDRFVVDHATTLQGINFREIWYCSRAGSVVKRLK